jgi:hypothetical protein
MKCFVKVTNQKLNNYLRDNDVYLCLLRKSRIRAKHLAIMEIMNSLKDLKLKFISNNPLGDVKGIIAVFINRGKRHLVKSYLKNLGYTYKFYLLDFNDTNPKYVWKKHSFSLKHFYTQNELLYQAQSSHLRKFKILGEDNSIKDVFGYRGDGSKVGKRALPVEDARCMVNLTSPSVINSLLDPFAGAGSIIYQGKYINENLKLYSIDIDPILEPGLKSYGAKHFVGCSTNVKLGNIIIDAIVTEVPFYERATSDIKKALSNLNNYLSKNGKVIIMCSKKQKQELKNHLAKIGLYKVFTANINRKGTSVAILFYTKASDYDHKCREFTEMLKYVY